MIRRYVILAPGIHQPRPQALAWGGTLGRKIVGTDPNQSFVIYAPGYITALAIGLPWVRTWTLHHHTKALQQMVLDLHQDNPDAEFDLIGHSFGTDFGYESMIWSGLAKTFWRRIVLMASIRSSRTDFSEAAGHFQGLLNLWSSDDEVVRLSTIGQSGWCGFRFPMTAVPPAKVEQQEMTNYLHGDYESPGTAWDAAAAFLAS